MIILRIQGVPNDFTPYCWDYFINSQFIVNRKYDDKYNEAGFKRCIGFRMIRRVM